MTPDDILALVCVAWLVIAITYPTIKDAAVILLRRRHETTPLIETVTGWPVVVEVEAKEQRFEGVRVLVHVEGPDGTRDAAMMIYSRKENA